MTLTIRKRGAWWRRALIVRAERPAAMPEEVVGDRDEERERRGDAVVRDVSATAKTARFTT